MARAVWTRLKVYAAAIAVVATPFSLLLPSQTASDSLTLAAMSVPVPQVGSIVLFASVLAVARCASPSYDDA